MEDERPPLVVVRQQVGAGAVPAEPRTQQVGGDRSAVVIELGDHVLVDRRIHAVHGKPGGGHGVVDRLGRLREPAGVLVVRVVELVVARHRSVLRLAVRLAALTLVEDAEVLRLEEGGHGRVRVEVVAGGRGSRGLVSHDLVDHGVGAVEVRRRDAAEHHVGEQVGGGVQRVGEVGRYVAVGRLRAVLARHVPGRDVRGVAEQHDVARAHLAVGVQLAEDVGLDRVHRRPDLARAGPDDDDPRVIARGLAGVREVVRRRLEGRRGHHQHVLSAEGLGRTEAELVGNRGRVHDGPPVATREVALPGRVHDRRVAEDALVVAAEVDGHVERREHVELSALRLVPAAGQVNAAHVQVAHLPEQSHPRRASPGTPCATGRRALTSRTGPRGSRTAAAGRGRPGPRDPAGGGTG